MPPSYLPTGQGPLSRCPAADPAMTIIRISDDSLLELLFADLTARDEVVASVRGPDELEISILGSLNGEAMFLATLLRVRAWEATQRSRGVDVYVDIE